MFGRIIKHPVFKIGFPLLIIAAGVAIYFMRYHKNVTPITSTAVHTNSSSSTAKNSSDKSFPSESSATSTKSVASAPATSSGTLATPTGTFVSSHNVHYYDSASSTTEESQCITSPGASCYMEFTQGSTVKQLTSQTTDSTGTTYWQWDPKVDGFGLGSWQIKAIATYNGQTQTAIDPMVLEIQQ